MSLRSLNMNKELVLFKPEFICNVVGVFLNQFSAYTRLKLKQFFNNIKMCKGLASSLKEVSKVFCLSLTVFVQSSWAELFGLRT